VLTGEMTLEVSDKYFFQITPAVVPAIQGAMESELGLAAGTVVIGAITDAAVTPFGAAQALLAKLFPGFAARRLGDNAGKVKVPYKVTDPSNKATPKKVADIAPKLPGAINKRPGVAPEQVAKAAIPEPTPSTKPTDPCAPVAPVPVAPVNPCAPVKPCAPVAKFSEQTDAAGAAGAAKSPVLPAMLWLAVPGLLGMVVLARKVRKERQTRNMASYNSMNPDDVESCAEGLE